MACMICGSMEPPIHVHGHTQCGGCGSLQEGCCEGASDCPESPPNTVKDIRSNDRHTVSDKKSEEHSHDDVSGERRSTS